MVLHHWTVQVLRACWSSYFSLLCWLFPPFLITFEVFILLFLPCFWAPPCMCCLRGSVGYANRHMHAQDVLSRLGSLASPETRVLISSLQRHYLILSDLIISLFFCLTHTCSVITGISSPFGLPCSPFSVVMNSLTLLYSILFLSHPHKVLRDGRTFFFSQFLYLLPFPFAFTLTRTI